MTNENENQKYEAYFPKEPQRVDPHNLDEILAYMCEKNTSDITIQSGEPIFAEIEGRMYRVTRRALTNSEVGDLINNIYGPNGTAQLLSGQDIDTYYEVRPDRMHRYRFRVNATACQVEGQHGIQITLRVIPTDPPPLSDMELPKELENALKPEDGVVYVTGATGSGKSTLLASIIRSIGEEPESHRKILTYEAPIEFVYDNVEMPTSVVSQSEVPRHIPSFAAGVRNALRRKPRLILVGEARDIETMSAVIEAALTGHPVYTTLHSTGVAECVRRLVGTFPREERHARTLDILETIRVVLWQKLVPTTDGKRTALREYLIFDESIRDQLLSVPAEEVTNYTRKLLRQQGTTMHAEAKRKYDEGIIDKRTYDLVAATSTTLDEDVESGGE